MDILHYSRLQNPTNKLLRPHPRLTVPSTSSSLSLRRFSVRSSLPLPVQNAKYNRELRAAVDAVERACCLCVDVKRSLFTSDGRILEKNDHTPVTIADFGVQALVSLELGKLFPSIPLVAEEDSAFLRSNNLVNSVVNVVTDKASSQDKALTQTDVLEAIDRGGKFGPNPATYWVLDPIDGTRGFLKGSEALYVVGLALVVEGHIVLGVMGCPNWRVDKSNKSTSKISGMIMVAHVGCGTWSKGISDLQNGMNWIKCLVDGYTLVHKGRFCISESQTWESLPLSSSFGSTTNVDNVGVKEVLLLPTCCGSLCKYLMVASGRASVFIQRARDDRVIKVTDWNGDQLDLAADEVERRALFPPGGILVSNNSLHKEILHIIASNSTVVS
ncbi:putative PAP-specific phosphatase, mitochondrial isoform X2 [Cynara cardunculus var. scolymus]|uniref:putative PAP-specific phosphatase, mitochondrial isoform X2 n=1 Tax=Cynara cardunculus var. scolymus TaxID=59895 RepID=UPI000D63029B|nr:putative PAP-specific phosphatase, mitochondrial isoform X2 [Cynara cardunculus var. scolymus]